MTAPTTTKDVGQSLELAACHYLQQRGLQLIERNYRTKGGEIDLIMRLGTTLVFVEVRYRAGIAHGGPTGSIGAEKRRRLLHAATTYLMQFAAQPTCRFDVVSMSGPRAAPDIHWIEAAFDATGGHWRP